MKVTIITVCRNARDTIEKTIQSVLSQDYNNIEYIIIDGKSTDNTLEIINKYKSKITKTISESDKGIYDAMNKGIKISKGMIINFLNSGDYYYNNNTISYVVRKFEKVNTDIIYGDAILYDEYGNIKKIHKNVDSISLARWAICHQAIFVKKSIFKKYGNFNIKYKINSDYEWLLRCIIKNKCKSLYVDKIIVNYLMGGLSETSLYKFYSERIKISLSYHGVFGFIKNNIILKIRNRDDYFLKI